MAFQANPVGPSFEEWRQLLEDTLGKDEGAAVAASLGCRKVVINVAISEEDRASGQGGKNTNVGTQTSCALSEVYMYNGLHTPQHRRRFRFRKKFIRHI